MEETQADAPSSTPQSGATGFFRRYDWGAWYLTGVWLVFGVVYSLAAGTFLVLLMFACLLLVCFLIHAVFGFRHSDRLWRIFIPVAIAYAVIISLSRILDAEFSLGYFGLVFFVAFHLGILFSSAKEDEQESAVSSADE